MTGTPTLPLPASKAFAAGTFAKIPVMLGVNHDEGRLFGLLQRASGRLSSAWSYHRLLNHDYGEAAAGLEARYPIGSFGSPVIAYSVLITDTVFACPAEETARLLSASTKVWLYEFDDPHAATSLPRVAGTPALGSAHATEIAYVLQRPWIMADPTAFNSAQRILSQRMQDSWGAFARTGAPNTQTAAPWPSFPSVQLFSPTAAPARASVFQRAKCR